MVLIKNIGITVKDGPPRLDYLVCIFIKEVRIGLEQHIKQGQNDHSIV